jgi:hypothetical protein
MWSNSSGTSWRSPLDGLFNGGRGPSGGATGRLGSKHGTRRFFSTRDGGERVAADVAEAALPPAAPSCTAHAKGGNRVATIETKKQDDDMDAISGVLDALNRAGRMMGEELDKQVRRRRACLRREKKKKKKKKKKTDVVAPRATFFVRRARTWTPSTTTWVRWVTGCTRLPPRAEWAL